MRPTEDHLNDLSDADLRTVALRILTDAVSAFTEHLTEFTGHLNEHGDTTTDLHRLDPSPVYQAAERIGDLLADPAAFSPDTLDHHRSAVFDVTLLAQELDEATPDGPDLSPLRRTVHAIDALLGSFLDNDRTAERPHPRWLAAILDHSGGGFIPDHISNAGYVIGALHPSDDPRHAALAESYLTSGLHPTIRAAIDEATEQLAILDDLEDLNRH